MAWSAPSLRQASALSCDPTVTITLAPNALASWIAMVPMPDEPPWISSVSPAFKRAALEHIVPDRHQRFRGRAGLHASTAPAGTAHRLGILRDAILRVAAAGHQRHHLVAELVLVGAGADRDHFAGDFEAGQVAGAGRRRIAAGALRHVGAVDARGRDLDQDLVRAGRRHRAGFGHQHLGAAGLADADDGHLRGQLFHDLSLIYPWRNAEIRSGTCLASRVPAGNRFRR